MSNSVSTPNFIMIELETMKLGEELRNFSPLANTSCNIMIYANKLANDPFVGLRVAINDMHRS